jgi:threo-3-hydroxy-L-aspartate ammonia-lyase
MAFFASRMKILVEPTVRLAAAAVFNRVIAVKEKKVGIVLSGGNIDIARFCELTKGASA